jgi:lipid-A-disaccharide synthase-like uncharacterized protein
VTVDAAPGWWDEVLRNARNPWFLVGILGQGIFAARFLFQWIASERKGRVVIPGIFWWCSLVGASITFAYGVHRRDPLILVAQAFGLVVYVRNLALHLRAGRGEAA